MMIIFQLALVVLWVSIACGNQCTCGISNPENPRPIQRVQKPHENKYPWMALLSVRTTDGKTHRCGGSIINDCYILTAAHCLRNARAIRVSVVVNNMRRMQRYQAAGYIMHPDYHSPVPWNDIGLIRLTTCLTFSTKIRPVCLPDSEMALASSFTLAGWGETDNGKLPNFLLEATLDEYSWESCKSEWLGMLKRSQFCAGNIGRGPCGGDSGSPLTQKVGERNYVVGVVTHVMRPCGSARNNVNTKVSSFVDWIRQNTLGAKYC